MLSRERPYPRLRAPISPPVSVHISARERPYLRSSKGTMTDLGLIRLVNAASRDILHACILKLVNKKKLWVPCSIFATSSFT